MPRLVVVAALQRLLMFAIANIPQRNACAMRAFSLAVCSRRRTPTARHPFFVDRGRRRNEPTVGVRVRGHDRHHPISSSLAAGANKNDGENANLSMGNLYREWTVGQDELLWRNRHKSIAELASILGRGLHGVQSRLAKLKDVDSPAYMRLFANKHHDRSSLDEGEEGGRIEKAKLVPVSEVLRRIEWDYSLPSEKFSVLHYDRVDDAIMESLFTAPNDSVKGPQEKLVDALPEHRIVAVKYRDRVVWDREERMDDFFSGEGILSVVETYDDWKRERDAARERNRQRQREMANQIRQVLGLDRFSDFQALSTELQSKSCDPTVPLMNEVENFVQKSLELFRKAREDPSAIRGSFIIPNSDFEALDAISELVALLPDAKLRSIVLLEISTTMRRIEGKSVVAPNSSTRQLPELNEDDITETFVRGSGPGGQKINKTSNRVVLVHQPTQLRVECQDTRSLQQNRKIARKRLRLKLDEHVNGSQSRESLKAEKAANKKAKAKARSRARQQRKRAAKEEATEA